MSADSLPEQSEIPAVGVIERYELFVARCTTPDVIGLPATCSVTAWVMGLSGMSGR